ncbi:MAG: aspartate aminotransferase family protein [Proteobacteria bacterium]|nr:aspartate aminotransferase family protein [Pseudomonadota bacterium]
MRTEAELLETARRYSFRGRMDKAQFTGPVFVRGSGTVVEDVNGKRFLDFNSGQMCAALGHNHPRVAAAVKEACDTLMHAHSSHFNVKEIELAERVAGIMPAPLKKTLFLQSGADANEAAVNIARKYTGGHDVASPHISFHGLSDTTRALTFAGWHAGYGPAAPGAHAIVAPYCYRCPLNHSFPACEFACLKVSFDLLDAEASGRPAAVITEPLFSAGGVIEPPPGWLKRLKEMCEARGMLLIVDEEQTGLGKLGTMFGFERDGVVPDVVTIAKHFGGGVSISAVTTSAEIEDKVAAAEFVVTHSHSNDPLICAAGIASLDVIAEEDVPAKARSIGQRLKERLTALAQRFKLIGDIRGRGLLQGIELVKEGGGREPAKKEGAAIARFCLERGLIFSQRRGGSVLRFVPPATTTPEQVDEAAEILTEGFERMTAGGGTGAA